MMEKTGYIEIKIANSNEDPDLINYQPIYDEAYLKELRSKAKNNWSGSFDPDKWLTRGGYGI
jgi:hypothetical protein